MIKKFKKKPVTVLTVEYTGDNLEELEKFVGKDLGFNKMNKKPYIKTLEGNMEISVNDVVIKGVDGEFYPCKPDIFKKTYEEV